MEPLAERGIRDKAARFPQAEQQMTIQIYNYEILPVLFCYQEKRLRIGLRNRFHVGILESILYQVRYISRREE